MALARHKLDEQVRLEALRLEEAAAVAVAKANAIDDELGFGTGGELPHLDLPEENSRQKVQHFIENQCSDPTPNTHVAPLNTPNQRIPSTEHVNPTPNAQVVPSSTPNQHTFFEHTFITYLYKFISEQTQIQLVTLFFCVFFHCYNSEKSVSYSLQIRRNRGVLRSYIVASNWGNNVS